MSRPVLLNESTYFITGCNSAEHKAINTKPANNHWESPLVCRFQQRASKKTTKLDNSEEKPETSTSPQTWLSWVWCQDRWFADRRAKTYSLYIDWIWDISCILSVFPKIEPPHCSCFLFFLGCYGAVLVGFKWWHFSAPEMSFLVALLRVHEARTELNLLI